MSDIGTITSIEPEDGLGWIELANGDRVRFGGTACKGFVPAVGMQVEVIGTRPGYGGTLKATELAKVKDAAPAPMQPGSASAPTAAAAAVAAPRTSLHTIQSSGVRADDLLLKMLASADVNDALHADLVAAGFDLRPAPGPELGCKNPWFYAVATDTSGNAYGLYAHPMFDGSPAQPWLVFSPSAGTLRWVAEDTAGLFPRVLASAAEGGADASMLARLRADLLKLGMPDVEGEAVGEGLKAAWLPPDESELRPVDDYLGESDGGEMERGLLAHAFRHGDARANESLRSIYEAWEWQLPSWVA